MIKVTDIDGRARYVAAEAVASVSEAGSSSQWHGIRAIVKLFDGAVIEAREEAGQLAAAVERARAAG